MSHIVNLALSCLLSNVIDLRRCIILSKLKETVVKEFFRLRIGVQMCILPAVSITSVVSKPNIEASLCQLN